MVYGRQKVEISTLIQIAITLTTKAWTYLALKANWNQRAPVPLSATLVSLPTSPCSVGWLWCASTCWGRSEGWNRASSTQTSDASWPIPLLAGDSHSLSPSSLSLPRSSSARTRRTIRWSGRPFASSTTRIRDGSWSSSIFPCPSCSSSTWSASSSVWSTWGQIQGDSVLGGKGWGRPFPNWRWAGRQEYRWWLS